jgi:anti-anti-sigma factor
MDISYQKQGGILTFHFSGLFEYQDESKLDHLCKNIISENPETVAIDMTKIESINSAGVAAMLSMLRIVDEKKIDFVIFGMNQRVQLVLEKVFIHDYIPLLSEEEFREKYL